MGTGSSKTEKIENFAIFEKNQILGTMKFLDEITCKFGLFGMKLVLG